VSRRSAATRAAADRRFFGVSRGATPTVLLWPFDGARTQHSVESQHVGSTFRLAALVKTKAVLVAWPRPRDYP
jgi:hypothetical protein